MPLIALLVTYRFINNISFSQTTSYLMLLIIKNILSDININHSAFLCLCFLGFSFPSPVFLTFTTSRLKSYIFIFGLQNVNTKRGLLPGFLFSLEEKFPIFCSMDRNVAGVRYAWGRDAEARVWLLCI